MSINGEPGLNGESGGSGDYGDEFYNIILGLLF